MFQSLKKYAGRLSAGALIAAAATSANAAVDLTSFTSGVSDATTAIGTVGAAVLGLIVATKIYKWVRRAM